MVCQQGSSPPAQATVLLPFALPSSASASSSFFAQPSDSSGPTEDVDCIDLNKERQASDGVGTDWIDRLRPSRLQALANSGSSEASVVRPRHQARKGCHLRERWLGHEHQEGLQEVQAIVLPHDRPCLVHAHVCVRACMHTCRTCMVTRARRRDQRILQQPQQQAGRNTASETTGCTQRHRMRLRPRSTPSLSTCCGNRKNGGPSDVGWCGWMFVG